MGASPRHSHTNIGPDVRISLIVSAHSTAPSTYYSLPLSSVYSFSQAWTQLAEKVTLKRFLPNKIKRVSAFDHWSNPRSFASPNFKSVVKLGIVVGAVAAPVWFTASPDVLQTLPRLARPSFNYLVILYTESILSCSNPQQRDHNRPLEQ